MTERGAIMTDEEIYDGEEGYTDPIGGYHVGGTDYAPSGEFCGECCQETCVGCETAQTQDSSLPTQVRNFITSRFSTKR